MSRIASVATYIIFVPRPQPVWRAAGFTEALRIAELAEQHGAMVAPHTAPELHGHLVLAMPRCTFGVESHGGPETDPLGYGLFREHPILRDGQSASRRQTGLRPRRRLGLCRQVPDPVIERGQLWQ